MPATGHDVPVSSPSSSPARRTIAVLVAGGIGTRMGSDLPKQLIDLAGRPILEHTIAAFDGHPGVDEVIVLMARGHLDAVHEIVRRGGYAKVTRVLEGAATRSDTTRRALAAVGEDDAHLLVHDGVRPLVTQRIITDCIAALAEYDAVGTAIASADTIVTLDEDGRMESIPARARLRRSQTPQCFTAATLRRAHALAAADPGFEATDDCGVVLRYTPDVPIGIVEGDARNLKVTEPLDLVIAEQLLRAAT